MMGNQQLIQVLPYWNYFPTTKQFQSITARPWLSSLALAFQHPKPGQSCHEAISVAQLGLAYLGLAWPGSWPQAGPHTALR